MSFTFPDLEACVQRARAAFAAALDGLDPWIWPNNIGPTAKVIGEGETEIWGRLATIEKRRFAYSSDWTGLLEHGREYRMPPKAARAAAGTVSVVSLAAITVADGATLTRTDGVAYRVSGAATLATAGTLTLTVTATTAGTAGNAASGQPLTLGAGFGGDGAASATVTVAMVDGGLDQEDVESYRARILFRKRNPPAAGAAADWKRWAESNAGIAAAFVERCWAGPGTVRVLLLGPGETGSPIPAASDVAAARAMLAFEAPAGSLPTILAATAQPIDVTISQLQPDTVAVREAILAELRDLFGRRRARASGGEVGVSGMPWLATPVTFSRSWIVEAVASAAGEDRHVLMAPSTDVVVAPGAVATLGSVAFAG